MLPILKLTDYLLPKEKVLWHKLPETKAPNEGKAKFIPLLTGAILVLFISPLIIHSFIIKTTQTTNFMFFIILIAIGIGLIGIGIAPVISYNTAKDIEYIITNQRVLIYPSPYEERNRPKIINLYEVNGDIGIKYNKVSKKGSIYIPTPHWNRIAPIQSRVTINNKAIIDPDIRSIKEPHKVRNILIEAIAYGKSTNWK